MSDKSKALIDAYDAACKAVRRCVEFPNGGPEQRRLQSDVLATHQALEQYIERLEGIEKAASNFIDADQNQRAKVTDADEALLELDAALDPDLGTVTEGLDPAQAAELKARPFESVLPNKGTDDKL